MLLLSHFASRSCFFLFLLASPVWLFAQFQELSFDYITADNGLAGNYVSCVFRDSKDFLWIGTNEQGVNKFNGYTFDIYENDKENPRSLSDNNVFCVFEDSRSDIWIGTANGLSLYEPETETFKVFRYSEDQNSLGSNRVYNIFEDNSQNLWLVCGNNGGLNKWIPEKEHFQRYYIPEVIDGIKGAPNRNSLSHIQIDSHGTFWISNSGADIYSFDPQTSSYKVFSGKPYGLSGGSYRKMVIDDQEILWIVSHKDGFYRFDTKTHEFELYGSEIGLTGSPERVLADIMLDDHDRILIAANQGGISVFNKLDKTFRALSTHKTQGLNSLGIRSLYIDKEGIFWVGTTRGGVNYYNPKKKKFNLIKHLDLGSRESLRNIIGWIYEDSQHKIWLATDGAGLDVYDPESGSFKNYSYDPTNPHSLSGDVIRCIEEDEKGNFWVGTWGSGLNYLDTKTDKFSHYNTSSTPISLNNNIVWNFKLNEEGNLWITPYLGGLDIFNKEKGVVRELRYFNQEPDRIPNDNVRFIYEDHNRNMWVCTVAGIRRFDNKTNSTQEYTSFPDNDIKLVYEAKDHTFWAGSVNEGIFQFDLAGNILKVYDENNGLSNNSVVSILEDNSGSIWAATKKGLNVINPSTDEIKNFYKSDGLQGDVFFELSALKTRAGLLYFGGYDGFNYFHPDSIKFNEYVPNIYFTSFKVYNKTVNPQDGSGILTKHISVTDEITMPSDISMFSIEYAAINYTNTNKTNYAYKLEGFDNDWNYSGSKRDATYTNLAPGQYTFKVKASNNDNVWNEAGRSLRIIIKPAFWQTWIFQFLVVFMLLSLPFAFYYLRLLRIRKRQTILTQLVAERTIELENQQHEIKEQAEALKQQNQELENQKGELNHALLELQQAQAQLLHSEKMASLGVLTAGVAHEINNPLNFIQTGLYAAEVVMKDENIKSEDLREILTKMNEGVRRASHIVKSLNTFSRKSGQSEKPCDIHRIIDNALFILDHELKYKCEIVKDYGANIADFELIGSEENLHQVFINVIMNASHAFEDTGTITITTKSFNNTLEIRIKDDGCGIPNDQINQIFDPFFTTKEPGRGVGLGLSVVYKIISEHQGTILYLSEVNMGTEVIITFPIMNLEHN